LLAAITTTVARQGYNQTTIADITKAAALSRRTFYEHFSNKEECFAAAYQEAVDRVRAATLDAVAEQEEWAQRVRSGLAGLLGILGEDPDLARLLLVAPANVGDTAATRHHLAMQELVAELLADPPGEPTPAPAAKIREQALAGGISRLVVRKINAGEEAGLGDLLPALVELVLTPYLGGEEAVRVAGERPEAGSERRERDPGS
jgi:AcrR family transcriptional regulator